MEPSALSRQSYIAFNFGAAIMGRRWLFDSYIELAKKIIAKGYYVVFLGGGGGRDYKAVLYKQLQHPRCINYICEDSGLTEINNILLYAAVVVSSETGPAHFAMALRVLQ